jgi:2-polyprenyl-3-methyl-5-hydroxy-6-metoxy-1,4-benzoquinol methylase
LFHLVTHRDYEYTTESGIRSVESDEGSTRRFVERFDGRLGFSGKSVLDVGCGLGPLCVLAAREGATRVVGIDLEVDLARGRIAETAPGLAERIELVETAGRLEELRGERFDLVVSKDAMEHYADPEDFARRMAAQVAPGGRLAIGFSPLWKSPQGGHIGYMTPVPWAHLIFAEETIMAERRRFRPEEDAASFAEVRGGLNKMTLARFRRLMGETGLEPEYFATNVGDSRAVQAMRVFSRARPLREYFTQSVYSLWRASPTA